MVDLYEDDDGFFEAHDREGTHRVPAALWAKYRTAVNRVADLSDQIEDTAVKPVYVTPDQEEAIRAACKPDAWIIVREAEVLREVSVLVPAQDLGPVAAPAPAAPLPEAAGTPVRPRPAPCPARGGLPHAALRYVITEVASIYDVGRTRVDGLCQCGERIPDVRCPHQKQELNARNQPACKWCRQELVSNAGAIDNRNLGWNGKSAHGAANPDIALPVPAGATDAPIDAYRAPGA